MVRQAPQIHARALLTGCELCLVIPAPLEAVFRLLITTFFMLYMFVVYADKKVKPPQ